MIVVALRSTGQVTRVGFSSLFPAILGVFVCFCFWGCGGSGSLAVSSLQHLNGQESQGQNLRLTVRLADQAQGTVNQAEEGTVFRSLRARLRQGEQDLQQLEVAIEPEQNQSQVAFTNVQPGTYTVVVSGFDVAEVLVAEVSATVTVQLGQVSRVTLVLRPGEVPPPPPPPPVLGRGYFVRQGATGSGLAFDDPSGDLQAVLELYRAEPLDFIYIFHTPDPLIVDGIAELPDGLLLIGEGSELVINAQAFSGQGVLGQTVVPAGERPLVLVNFEVGSDVSLLGFHARQGPEGFGFDINGQQNVLFENMIVDGTGAEATTPTIHMPDFQGLFHFVESTLVRDTEVDLGLVASCEQGVTILRAEGSEFGLSRNEITAVGVGTQAHMDFRGNTISAVFDFFHDVQSQGDVLLENNDFVNPGNDNVFFNMSRSTGVTGRLHVLNNRWDNYSRGSIGCTGSISELAWIGNTYTGNLAQRILLFFTNGTLADVVIVDNVFQQGNVSGDPDIQLDILPGTGPSEVRTRVSNNTLFNGLAASALGAAGSLNIGILENDRIAAGSSRIDLDLSSSAEGATLCTLVRDNVVNFVQFLGPNLISTSQFIFEVIDVDDTINDYNTVLNSASVTGVVASEDIPGICEFPEATVNPIVFPNL